MSVWWNLRWAWSCGSAITVEIEELNDIPERAAQCGARHSRLRDNIRGRPGARLDYAMEKDFDRWNKLKKAINASDSGERVYFHEGDIWWCTWLPVNVNLEGARRNRASASIISFG